jgi:hypothetical protein
LQGGCGGVDPHSPSSKRSSGFWGQEVGWDACHEISAESGEGVEELFRVVTRKLVEQNRKMQAELLAATGSASGLGAPGFAGGEGEGYFDARGSFRVGRDRRSWLFSPGFSPALGGGSTVAEEGEGWNGERRVRTRKGCC